MIPSELNEKKKNLFHYVSPIIAFLIIFYIHSDKKSITLDELATRSGLKQLYKNVKVPIKEHLDNDDNSKNNGNNDNESEDESDDEDDDDNIGEDDNSP